MSIADKSPFLEGNVKLKKLILMQLQEKLWKKLVWTYSTEILQHFSLNKLIKMFMSEKLVKETVFIALITYSSSLIPQA